MTQDQLSLADFGWSAHFQSQLDLSDLEETYPVRVTAIHRNGADIVGPDYAGRLTPIVGDVQTETATAGDWLLIERTTLRLRRILARRSLFKRRAAGTAVRTQLIAANVDTLFIVSSCNLEFNAPRIERYLALAREAEVTPIIVLTKADLSRDKELHVQAAAELAPGLLVEALDARSPAETQRLAPWCGRGQTVALLGSSGVGKSTLLNTLGGGSIQSIGGIREGDDRGKHTTTARSLHRLPYGAWLMDTPGIRELQLADVGAGIREVFADVAELAAGCRFRDCQHETEPGCAIQSAIEAGSLDKDRLTRYRKLLREDARNTESLAEAHARIRAFGRLARRSAQAKRDRTGF